MRWVGQENFVYLREQLTLVAQKHGESVLRTDHNPISLGTCEPTARSCETALTLHRATHGCVARCCRVGLTLTTLGPSKATQLGAMLFTRQVSGARVVTGTVSRVLGLRGD